MLSLDRTGTETPGHSRAAAVAGKHPVNQAVRRCHLLRARAARLGNAMRFLLTAEEFGAAEALRIGLVQEVVRAGAHVTRATELAHLIARQAPLGVHATLVSARAALGRGPDAGRDAIASLLPGIMRSQDAAEGLRSFIERREANFTGH